MPLDIKMDVDINSVHEHASNFRKIGDHADNVGSGAGRARSNSESGWGGEAGPGFRSCMSDMTKDADKIAKAAREGASKADQIAGLLDHAKKLKQNARDVAAGGGCRTTEDQIFEPGPAPKPPGQLPDNPNPQQKQDHEAATQAQDAFHAKAKAYQDAARMNAEADKARKQAAEFGRALVGSDGFKTSMVVTSTVAGLAGAAITRSSQLRNIADGYRMLAGGAQTSASMADAVGDNEKYSQAMRERQELLGKADAASKKAEGRFVTQALNKLPGGMQRVLTGDYGETLGKNAGRLGKSFAKRIPVVGGMVSAAGAGWDIAHGKNPTKTIVSGVASTAAGSAASTVAAGTVSSVGTAIGVGEAAGAVAGPVGLVAGAAVGAGVGMLVDHWDDVTGWVGSLF